MLYLGKLEEETRVVEFRVLQIYSNFERNCYENKLNWSHVKVPWLNIIHTTGFESWKRGVFQTAFSVNMLKWSSFSGFGGTVMQLWIWVVYTIFLSTTFWQFTVDFFQCSPCCYLRVYNLVLCVCFVYFLI